MHRNRSDSARFVAFLLSVILIVEFCAAAVKYNCNSVVSATGEIDEGDFKKGDTPTLCIHFLPYKIKVGLKTKVDQSGAYTVRSGYDVVKYLDTDIVVQLSNSNKLSPQIVK